MWIEMESAATTLKKCIFGTILNLSSLLSDTATFSEKTFERLGAKSWHCQNMGWSPPPSSKKSSVCGYFCSDIAIFGHLRGFWGTFWLSRHKKTSQLCQAFVVAFFPPMHYVALQYYLIVSIALLVTGEQLFKYCIAVIMLIPDHKWSYHWSLALARKTLAPWKYFGFRKGLLLYWLRALSINRKRIWLQDRGRHLMLFGFVSNMVGKYIWYHLALYYVWLWLWCCSNAMKCNAMLTM